MNKTFLNVASSTNFLENFINLDSSIYIKLAKVYPITRFIIGKKYKDSVLKYRNALKGNILLEHDCRKKLDFDNATVDHILCSHFLEHVYPNECKAILTDFHRVLKPNATLHLILPDMKILINNYLNSNELNACDQLIRQTLLTKEERPSLGYRFLEFTGRYGLQHYWMYDKNSMAIMLKNIGFKITLNDEHPSAGFRKNDMISFHLIAIK